MSERDDAACVYRHLRAHGPDTLGGLVDACFPVLTAGPASSVAAVQRRSVGRALSAVVWMRAHGVSVTCASIPGFMSEYDLGVTVTGTVTVTATESLGDSMDEVYSHSA